MKGGREEGEGQHNHLMNSWRFRYIHVPRSFPVREGGREGGWMDGWMDGWMVGWLVGERGRRREGGTEKEEGREGGREDGWLVRERERRREGGTEEGGREGEKKGRELQ